MNFRISFRGCRPALPGHCLFPDPVTATQVAFHQYLSNQSIYSFMLICNQHPYFELGRPKITTFGKESQGPVRKS